MLVNNQMVPPCIALAKRVFEAQRLPGERPSGMARRKELKKQILAYPVTFNWALCEIEDMPGEWRLNGQHTSQVLLELIDEGVDISSMLVNMQVYRVKDIAEAMKYWATFDSGISARTNNDVVRAVTESVHPLSGQTIQIRKLLVNGLALAACGVKGMRFRPITKATMLVNAVSDAAPTALREFIFDLLTEKTPVEGGTVTPSMISHKSLASSATIAAMIRTALDISFDADSNTWEANWRTDKGVWHDFWGKVGNGAELSEDDIRHMLRDWLISANKVGFQLAEEAHRCSVCIQNWNYWRQGKLVKGIKARKTDVEPLP